MHLVQLLTVAICDYEESVAAVQHELCGNRTSRVLLCMSARRLRWLVNRSSKGKRDLHSPVGHKRVARGLEQQGQGRSWGAVRIA